MSLETLFQEVTKLQKKLDHELPAIYDTEINSLYISIINYLGKDKLTVPQIAHFHHSSRQNIQVAINELKTLGVVTTEPNHSHKRSPLYKLSTIGQQMYNDYQNNYQKFLDKLSLDLSDDEIKTTSKVLNTLSQLF